MTKEKDITLDELKEITAELDDGTVISVSFGGDDDGKQDK